METLVETTSTLTYIIYGAIFLISIILIMMWGMPRYSIYSSRKRGEAELVEANFAEQVAIAQATARKNSARLNKEAEIIDAETVAESIAKIGDALKNNAGYLQWQWIKNIADTENEVIYVPTEANIPIMEAGKRYLKSGLQPIDVDEE